MAVPLLVCFSFWWGKRTLCLPGFCFSSRPGFLVSLLNQLLKSGVHSVAVAQAGPATSIGCRQRHLAAETPSAFRRGGGVRRLHVFL